MTKAGTAYRMPLDMDGVYLLHGNLYLERISYDEKKSNRSNRK